MELGDIAQAHQLGLLILPPSPSLPSATPLFSRLFLNFEKFRGRFRARLSLDWAILSSTRTDSNRLDRWGGAANRWLNRREDRTGSLRQEIRPRPWDLGIVAATPHNSHFVLSIGISMAENLAENLDPGAHDLSGVVAELGLENEAERPLDVASTISPTVKIVKPKGLAAHFHCPNTLPLPSLWPDRPLLLRESSIHEVRHGRRPQIPK